MRTCKICKTKFQPKYSTVQMTCSVKCAIEYTNKSKQKEWKKRKAKVKRELMTLQDHIKIAQAVFNTFIRLRDKGQPCISCQKPAKKENAGHFYNANNHYLLRFDEDNVHLQCEYCNTYLSSNGNEYRKNIVFKIGQDRLDRLDELSKQTANYSIPDIQEITKKYKEKIRILNNNN